MLRLCLIAQGLPGHRRFERRLEAEHSIEKQGRTSATATEMSYKFAILPDLADGSFEKKELRVMFSEQPSFETQEALPSSRPTMASRCATYKPT